MRRASIAACLAATLWLAGTARAEEKEAPSAAPDAAMEEASPPPAPAATAEAAAQPEATPQGEVARAIFTSAVEEREPVDQVSEVPSSWERVVFFTELRGLAGHTVTHRWEHDGQVAAEVPFEVGGPRWRVWSSKEIPREATGEWTVSVVDDTGSVLESRSFDYTEAVPASPAPADE
jgi:hypothetical protein